MRAINEILKKTRAMVKNTRNTSLEVELCEVGQSMCEYAFSSKMRRNVTYNQRDAYGWALWYNKTLINHGFIGEKMAKQSAQGTDEEIWGRNEAERLIDIYVPDKNGYCLLVTNAIWYSVTQENRKMPVLSQATSWLEELAEKYNGTVRFGMIR